MAAHSRGGRRGGGYGRTTSEINLGHTSEHRPDRRPPPPSCRLTGENQVAGGHFWPNQGRIRTVAGPLRGVDHPTGEAVDHRMIGQPLESGISSRIPHISAIQRGWILCRLFEFDDLRRNPVFRARFRELWHRVVAAGASELCPCITSSPGDFGMKFATHTHTHTHTHNSRTGQPSRCWRR
jgi:hypothetical protein